MSPSTVKLVAALEEAKCPRWLIDCARAGDFHDFESRFAFPELRLHSHLVRLEYTELAARVAAGDFDATKAESDAWWEREGRQVAREAGVLGAFEPE